MGVEQVFLELFGLLWSQHDFCKFANASVDPVHDFADADLPLEKATALVDPRNRVRV